MTMNGKVALVTGAGSGIGRATAVMLAKAGARVGLLSRTKEEIESAAEEIRSAGGEAISLTADVSDETALRSAVDELVRHFGGLDICVANAGINGVWAPIDDLKPEEFDKTIAVNLRGTYLTLHIAVPHLKKAGGSIVIVSSINGNRTFTSPGATAYSATKAAQVAISKQLALELGRHHIRVNAVCPGEIETEIDDNTNRRHVEQTKIPVTFPEGQIPVSDGKPGKASDVADVILFLASDQSRHVTGTAIYVDGGQGLLR
ncbi:SDR family NAD(P)-dependent oxidoreductase [Rhizobium sp. SSA_523]|uniref:SDR family oxidoreductase n=1 Tax=Rhizobium sp. SSA_523 TaxID=2952477 RepID=UPI0020906919|nr:SDR family NAD(P)-dependent oxidoreductase [Rhizobium sp. SSA_523]MCO5732272.1 SDR family oxidoreductase [Rhizobium sp. SSA_523]WKC21323.1 SDR family NAD(P)-dependent oxidoreductase [Rhizobium sp. SSA_523]